MLNMTQGNRICAATYLANEQQLLPVDGTFKHGEFLVTCYVDLTDQMMMLTMMTYTQVADCARAELDCARAELAAGYQLG